MRKLAQRIVSHRRFEHFIIVLILINAVILGLETVPRLEAEYGW